MPRQEHGSASDRPFGRQLRQSGVRHATDADRRVTGEVPQVLAHLRRAGRAVQPDHVDAEWLERCEGGTDLRAEQHGACGLDSHVHDHRKITARVRQCALRTQRRRLRLQQILRGLDQDGVDVAGEHAFDLLLVGISQPGVRDMAQGWQLRAGADAPKHPAAPFGRAVGVGRLARNPGGRLRQFGDSVRDAVLPKRR